MKTQSLEIKASSSIFDMMLVMLEGIAGEILNIILPV